MTFDEHREIAVEFCREAAFRCFEMFREAEDKELAAKAFASLMSVLTDLKDLKPENASKGDGK